MYIAIYKIMFHTMFFHTVSSILKKRIVHNNAAHNTMIVGLRYIVSLICMKHAH